MRYDITLTTGRKPEAVTASVDTRAQAETWVRSWFEDPKAETIRIEVTD